MRADDIAFRANSEQLALHRVEVKARVQLFREDLIERPLQDGARCLAIHRRVLEAVGNPHVRHTRRAERLAELRPDLTAGDAMIDPELADTFVPAAQGETVIRLWMG